MWAWSREFGPGALRHPRGTRPNNLGRQATKSTTFRSEFSWHPV